MDDWYVSVSLVEPLTSTFTGNAHEGRQLTPYAQDKAGVWCTWTDKTPAGRRVQELLDYAIQQAQERRVSELACRWGENGPEMVEQ